MYVLHIGNKNYSSWSLRPWVLLKGLGIPFTEELHRFSAASADGAFKSFSPSGRVPCLVDGSTVVWDSFAITEYVHEDHPQVWPRARAARAWARSACAEMHSGFSHLRNLHSMNVGVRIAVEKRPPELLADIARIEQLWNEGLERFGGPFLGGADFTAADAFFAPVAFRFRTYGVAVKGLAAEYWPRLLQLPAMKEWERAALAEAFRDEGHDAGLKLAGTVIEDLRAPPR